MKFAHLLMRAVAIAMLGFAVAPAQAQEQAGPERLLEAADRFDRLAAEASSRGELPRSSNPEVAEILGQLSNPSGLMGGDVEPVEIMRVASRLLGVATLYTDHGVAPGSSAAGNMSTRNLIAYQEEVVPLFEALTDMFAVAMRTVALQHAARSEPPTEQQTAGIRRMRAGLEEMITGIVAMSALEGLSPERRLALVSALARNSPVLAATLTLTQRRSFVAQAAIARERLGPQARQQVDRLIAVFGATHCSDLCAF